MQTKINVYLSVEKVILSLMKYYDSVGKKNHCWMNVRRKKKSISDEAKELKGALMLKKQIIIEDNLLWKK